MMKLMKQAVCILLISLLASGCSFPGVYKIPVQQGNIVSQKDLDLLKTGMTKKQVQYLLGTPLIQDSFHQEQWSYVYSIETTTKSRDQYLVTVTFNGERYQEYQVQGDLSLSEIKPRKKKKGLFQRLFSWGDES